MISLRQILIIALLIAGFWLLRRLRRQLIARRPQRTRRPLYNEMVRCAHCGIHVPRARAVGDARSRYFCSDQHRLAQQTALNQDSG